jgi:hypothetical protein
MYHNMFSPEYSLYLLVALALKLLLQEYTECAFIRTCHPQGSAVFVARYDGIVNNFEHGALISELGECLRSLCCSE